MINTISKNIISIILTIILIGTFNVFPCFAYDSNEFNHDFGERDLKEVIDLIPLVLGPIDIDGVLVSRVIEINDDDWDIDWNEEENKDDDLDEDWIEKESRYDSWSGNWDKEKGEDDYRLNGDRDIEKSNDDDWDIDWDNDWDFKFHAIGDEMKLD